MFGTGVATFWNNNYGERMANVVHENDFIRGYVFDYSPGRIIVRPPMKSYAYIYALGDENPDGTCPAQCLETRPVYYEDKT